MREECIADQPPVAPNGRPLRAAVRSDQDRWWRSLRQAYTPAGHRSAPGFRPIRARDGSPLPAGRASPRGLPGERRARASGGRRALAAVVVLEALDVVEL